MIRMKPSDFAAETSKQTNATGWHMKNVETKAIP